VAFPLVAGTVGEPTDVHAGMVAKRVRVATVAAGTLATSFENGDTVDGVTLATDDRILIKDQASGGENGIYTVNASGAPTRSLDFDESAESLSGTLVVVSEGTSNKDSIWLLTTNAPITLGTTALVFFPVHMQGSGTPESAVTAPVGATYVNTSGSTGTTFYRKESGTGNTGWSASGGGGLGSGCRATSSTTQSIPNSTNTAITWATEAFDRGGWHSTSVNTSRMTVPSGQDGVVDINAGVLFADNSTGLRRIIIAKNGSAMAWNSRASSAGVNSNQLNIAVSDDAVAGDYYEVLVQQDSGGALNVDGSPAAGVMFFSISRAGG
jgi:hypothetical protein